MRCPNVRSVIGVLLLWAAFTAGMWSVPAGAIQDNTLNAAPRAIWQTNAPVWAVAVANGKLFAGGAFTSVRPPGSAAGSNETPRNSIAAFDAGSGDLLAFFDHTFDGRVQALAVSTDGSTVYAGGQFTHVDGLWRAHLAAFNTSTGAINTSWHPNATGGGVQAIAVAPDGTVYFGGDFTTVSGNKPRTRLGAAASSGAVLDWAPTADKSVAAINVTPDDSRVIVGGAFDHLNGVTRHGVGAVDPTTGAIEPWAYDPVDPTSVVKTITSDASGAAYVGAEGTGGGIFDGTFSVNYADGTMRWIDDCLGATQAVVLLNGWLFNGSHMHDCQGLVAGGPPQQSNTWWHLTVESQVDGHIGYWFPNTNGKPLGPKAMTTDGSQLFVGGDFTTVNNKAQQGLTRFGGPPDTTFPKLPPPPAASSTVAGTVFVNWQTTTDLDDGALTYRVYRDGGTSALGSSSATASPWERRTLCYTDTVPSGSTHSYKVNATDGTNVGPKATSPSVTVAGATPAYVSAVRSDGPGLYWRLDESAGAMMVDSSGSCNAGLIRSGETLSQPGAVLGDSDAAVALAGGNGLGLISAANRFTDPQGYSIEAWFKTTTNSGGKIVGFGSAVSGNSQHYDRHIYMTNSGQLDFGVFEGSPVVIQSPATYRNGQWHHVVATIDSTLGMALYVDGAQVASHVVDPNGKYGYSQHFDGYWRLGGDSLSGWPQAPSSNYFSGSVDEVAIYDHALTAAQVAAHYAAAGY
jgi:hypothetical protein